jgi:hypothetical protein
VKLPIVWLTEAATELQEARAYYDNIRPELGERFARAVDAAIDAIAERPLQFPAVHRGRRRAGVWRFPYGVFFDIQKKRILIICLLPRQAQSEALARPINLRSKIFSPGVSTH